MAINYNLSKVNEISENDDDFVLSIIELFTTEIPTDLKALKAGIKEKNHQAAYAFAHKIKPTLDLMGMNPAYEEILYIEDWTKRLGKRKEVKETFKSLKDRIKKAVKEIRKDFNIN
jgi:HPt (histidine-containing phosphotransfer) domain-containing protein